MEDITERAVDHSIEEFFAFCIDRMERLSRHRSMFLHSLSKPRNPTAFGTFVCTKENRIVFADVSWPLILPIDNPPFQQKRKGFTKLSPM